MSNRSYQDYGYSSTAAPHTSAFWPLVREELSQAPGNRVFELGCGNGSFLRTLGPQFVTCGVDASESGIAQARSEDSEANVHVASAYDKLSERFGQWDAVVSLEVVEHLYDPRAYVSRIRDLLVTGGRVIVSTPYHGYWKNLALAVTGKWDSHLTALWDGGHIKFWSIETLTKLFEEQGFERERVIRHGRIPPLAMSMILTFVKG